MSEKEKKVSGNLSVEMIGEYSEEIEKLKSEITYLKEGKDLRDHMILKAEEQNHQLMKERQELASAYKQQGNELSNCNSLIANQTKRIAYLEGFIERVQQTEVRQIDFRRQELHREDGPHGYKYYGGNEVGAAVNCATNEPPRYR